MGWFGAKRSIQQLVEDHYMDLYRFAYRLVRHGSRGGGSDAGNLLSGPGQARAAARRRPGQRLAVHHPAQRLPAQAPRSHRHEHTLSLDNVPDVPERLPEPLPDVDPEQLQHALSELPEDFRTPLLLFYFEDFSYREIAQQMQVPLGTVMSRLARAKAFLRGRLFTYQTPILTVRRDARDRLHPCPLVVGPAAPRGPGTRCRRIPWRSRATSRTAKLRWLDAARVPGRRRPRRGPARCAGARAAFAAHPRTPRSATLHTPSAVGSRSRSVAAGRRHRRLLVDDAAARYQDCRRRQGWRLRQHRLY